MDRRPVENEKKQGLLCRFLLDFFKKVFSETIPDRCNVLLIARRRVSINGAFLRNSSLRHDRYFMIGRVFLLLII
jgi:hypothetical protein